MEGPKSRSLKMPSRSLRLLATVRVCLVVCLASLCITRLAFAFDHQKHLAIKESSSCTTCHSSGEAADHIRPGKDGHSICDDANCHAKEFSPEGYAASKICADCHLRRSRISDPGNLKPFPSADTKGAFLVDFNHQVHLIKANKDLKNGCRDCHELGGSQGTASQSKGHARCAKCHDAKSSLPMTACAKCHLISKQEDKERLATRSIAGGACRVRARFRHDQHTIDGRKKETVVVSCDACHFSVAKATTLAGLVLTQGQATMLKACGKCHRTGEKKKDGTELFATIGDCTRCHIPECIAGGPAPAWHK